MSVATFEPREAGRALPDRLNAECFCIALNRVALDAALAMEARDANFALSLLSERPHLISTSPVFLATADRAAMLDAIEAIESAARLPQYQAQALERSAIATPDFGPLGAFMGYDFHITDSGPKLIEVNTNAGGAFLNAFVARAQLVCCAPVHEALRDEARALFEQTVLAMFAAEWRSQRADAPLKSIAIVDDGPRSQYLYPEFVLAQRLFERAGYDALIADAAELTYDGGTLSVGGRSIDIVYNRLTDFSFGASNHDAMRRAYLDGAVVVTPSPRNHALLADKRNLVVLSDADLLSSWGLDRGHVEHLRRLPKSVAVEAANADELWTERKRYYFKPAEGHAGKASIAATS